MDKPDNNVLDIYQHISDPENRRQLDLAFKEAPPCFTNMNGQVVDLKPGQELTIRFPVKDTYLNPAASMQGGLISAAFDNVFGPLCWLASGTPGGVMTELITSYHRPIFLGDDLTIQASVKVQGRRKVHMVGEAVNNQGKIIATATATYLILDY